MKKEINIEEKLEKLLKTIIIFSCPVLTIILSNRYVLLDTLIGGMLSFFIMSIFIKKVSLKSINKTNGILSILLSSYMMKFFLNFTKDRILKLVNYILNTINLDFIYNYVYAIIGIFALPALIFFVYSFINKILPNLIQFFKGFTIVEKRYFKIVICVGILITVSVILTTTAFSKPNLDGNRKNFNVIYTADSGGLLKNDAFLNPSHDENDVRQPLFGVFSLPFSILAHLISNFVFFIPENYEYETIMTIIQFILTTITTIMIARLLKTEEKDKKYVYLLFSLSFPYLIFNLVIEQYVIGLFYLILTIYMFYNSTKINYTYVGALGTMLTSGVLLPFMTKFKNIKQYFKDIFKCFIAFMAIVIISGQFGQIMLFKDKLNSLLNDFAGGQTFYNKLCQFLNFIKSIFLSAKGEIIGNTYQLATVENLSIIGIIIFTIIVISSIINRKEKMARISFLWVCFSVLILLIIGWGTIENGLILYSLYFAWAYLILYYLFLKKIFKDRELFVFAIIITAIIMAIFNLRELFNIITFAVKYY